MQPNDQLPPDDTNAAPVETATTENITQTEPTQTVDSAPAETVTSPVTDVPSSSPDSTVGEVTPVSATAPAPTASTTSRFGFLKSKKAKIVAIIVAVLVVLGAGSAGAYFGIIVPNKPENVLKSAIANTLKERQISYDGTVDVQAVDTSKAGATPATSVTFKGGSDLDKNATKAELAVTVSGVKVQGEIRYVDQTGYVKLGDLTAIKNLATAYSPDAASAISKVENQWIEIDKTLVKQAKADCVLDTKLMLSDADVKMLSDAYTKTPFTTIKSTSSDPVNGKAATKFELAIDDNKLGDYAKNFDNVSLVKQLKSCSPQVSDKANYNDLKDNDTTPLTVWVDKGSKRIVKIAGHTTDQDEKKNNTKGTASVTLSYGPVTVDKPANAKPIMTLISEFAPLFSGGVQGAESTDPFSLLSL
jgi:hypothetical protein